MSIFKSTFKQAIQTQLGKRQEAILNRTPTAIQYLNSRNAWIRMTSSVNVNGSNDLAKKYILQGGVLSDTGLRSGIGKANEAYSTVSPGGGTNRLGIRPMPGITGIDIKSKSAYGSLREVEVKFNCWDIRQLEDLELLYMRPGYTVLVEWGWLPYLDNTGALQNNIDFTKNDIINKKPTKEELFKNIYSTAVDTYGGNYDGSFGYIKNYGWSARNDGGYDCSVTVISIGEVMESLTVNYAPLNYIDVITKGGGLLSSDLDSEDLKKQYSQNILAGLFYEIWSIGVKIPDAETSSIEDKKKNSSYDIFRKKINISGGEGDADSEGTVGASDVQVYITLESLCNLMNNYVIVKDSNSKSSYVKCSVLEREYEYGPLNPDSSTGEGGYLLSLAHPLQVSMDPSVCVINASLWISGDLPSIATVAGLSSPPNNPTSEEAEKIKEAEKKTEESQTKATEEGSDNLKFLSKLKPFFYKADYKEEMGIIGNIYVNVNHLYRLSINNELESQDTKEKNEINLYDYLKQIMSAISSAIGSVNNFDIHVDPVDNIIRIIDINYVEAEKNRNNVYENLFKLEMHNTKSTVRSYKLESQIFPDQSAIIAIGAQAGGGALATDNNTMLDFNKGLEDRIIPKKVDPLNDPDRTTAENAISQFNNLFSLFDIFYGFFNRLDDTSFFGVKIEDSDFNTEKADQYKNALKDLISFYKNITNSDIKNRSIIPTKLSITMDGIGGLVIGHMFKIPEDLLPKGYKGEGYGSKVGYIITSIGHSVANNDWTTNIDAQTVILSNPSGDNLTFPDVIEGEGNEKTKKAIEGNKKLSDESKKETVKDSGNKSTSKPRKTANCNKSIKNITQANAPGVNISDRTPWNKVKSLYPIVNGPINISAVGTPYDGNNDFAYKMKSTKVYKRPNRKIDHIVLHYTAGGFNSDPTNCYKGTWEKGDASADFVITGYGKIAGFKNFRNLTSWHYGRECTWGPSINNSSIGIEIESYGYLTYCQTSNKFINAYNGEMNAKEVCLTRTYRGLNMWHAHSDVQISATANLIIALYNEGVIHDKTKFIQGVKSTGRYNILFPEQGLKQIPPPGIITHGTGRNGKVDTFPQKSLLDMLDDLPSLIQSNPKTKINWVTSI